jgi:hypothetical protein
MLRGEILSRSTRRIEFPIELQNQSIGAVKCATIALFLAIHHFGFLSANPFLIHTNPPIPLEIPRIIRWQLNSSTTKI